MSPIPLVRVNAFLPYVQFLNQIGTPIDRLMEQTGIPILVLNHPESLMPFIPAINFLEKTARLEGIEDLGLLVAQQISADHLGAFGKCVCQAATLYELLQTIIRLIKTEFSGEEVWLSEEEDSIWFHTQYLVAPYIATRHAQNFTVLLYLKTFQLALGPAWQPEELHLQVGNSKWLAKLECLSNTRIRFDQPYNAIKLPKAQLRLPIHHPLQTLQPLSKKAEVTLLSTAPAPNFVDSLQQLILILLKDNYPSISLVAEVSGMSVRSFQRRLAESNLSYSKLVEKVRIDEAMRLLHDPSIKLTEIAFELGYQSPENFTRAFRRWAGVSPREFRTLNMKRGSA